MREKLLSLMKSEGLKPSQLAEALEINPAGISHLMAGRNKPGFELLQKMLRRFPRINPDWLLLDSPQMYREVSAATPRSAESDLFGLSKPVVGQNELPTQKAQSQQPSENRTENTATGIPPKYVDHADLQIERVVVFYSDHSFESYTPKH